LESLTVSVDVPAPETTEKSALAGLVVKGEVAAKVYPVGSENSKSTARLACGGCDKLTSPVLPTVTQEGFPVPAL
jgi:hypothetical protein